MQQLDGTKGVKLKRTKHMEERVVDRPLTFELTEDDYSRLGKDAGEAAHELRSIGGEFEKVKKTWKENIDAADGRLVQILSTIREGKEKRQVKCIERKDFQNSRVDYIFDGEIMESRAMYDSERQAEFTLTKPGQKAKDVEFERAEPKSEDVGAVIKEETSRRSKKDASTN